MIVEIWSDVVCPWCYIGKKRFETALDAFTTTHGSESNGDVEVDVRYRAFMLDPGAPVGVSQSVKDVYETKFGGEAEAQNMMSRVTEAAAGEGIEFRLDLAQRTNTGLAHRLLVLAEQEGRQLDLVSRLFAAYFSEGQPLAVTEDLVPLAVDVGMDPETVRAWLNGDGGRDAVEDSLDFAARSGLTGVPAFVFDREIVVAGAQSPEVLLDVLEGRRSAPSAS